MSEPEADSAPTCDLRAWCLLPPGHKGCHAPHTAQSVVSAAPCPACAPAPAPSTGDTEPNPWADAPNPEPPCGLPWTAHPTFDGMPYCNSATCPARAAVPKGTGEKEQGR